MTVAMRKLKFFFRQTILVGLALACTGCQLTTCELEPHIVCPPPSCITKQPSAFFPLSEDEWKHEWAKELVIGDAFAKEWDLYRAITSYKRALILMGEPNERRLQIEYDIILCYYLGCKYCEALEAFENSCLTSVNPAFPAFNQLLLMVYDCYLHEGKEDRAAAILETIQKFSPETSSDLNIYHNLMEGRLCELQAEVDQHPDFETIQPELDAYYSQSKSPTKARQLNALFPGAGYYYVGQTKTAVTAFLINALFILASYECFHHGYPAAGIITASLESGWYFGGINGAGIEAQEYNNRLYDGMSTRILKDHCFFPVLMFETSF
jgi:tetratricopeptide (TPR) repeat protein